MEDTSVSKIGKPDLGFVALATAGLTIAGAGLLYLATHSGNGQNYNANQMHRNGLQHQAPTQLYDTYQGNRIKYDNKRY